MSNRGLTSKYDNSLTLVIIHISSSIPTFKQHVVLRYNDSVYILFPTHINFVLFYKMASSTKDLT